MFNSFWGQVGLCLLGLLGAIVFLELCTDLLALIFRVKSRKINFLGFSYDRKSKKVRYQPLANIYGMRLMLGFPTDRDYLIFGWLRLLVGVVLYVYISWAIIWTDNLAGWATGPAYFVEYITLYVMILGGNQTSRLKPGKSNTYYYRYGIRDRAYGKLNAPLDEYSFIYLNQVLDFLLKQNEAVPNILAPCFAYINAALNFKELSADEKEKIEQVFDIYHTWNFHRDTYAITPISYQGELATTAILLGRPAPEDNVIAGLSQRRGYQQRLNYLTNPNEANRLAYQKAMRKLIRIAGVDSVTTASAEKYFEMGQ
ncbi:hypothetical protein [Eupransor demetentiae]|uniref:Uncharacterized protein n=1 Tax=Eupransor demetentiae TaxID=3109584 RepID=A0ABM9N6A8_9LACO|nr:hypothetical protein R54876_GBNLAHCA_01295 [Lactobacillaceae bacterium LMG 33000]